MDRFHISDELISYIWIVRINFARNVFHVYPVDKRPQNVYLLRRQNIYKQIDPVYTQTKPPGLKFKT